MPELTSTRCNFSPSADARTVDTYARFYEKRIISDPERMIILAQFEHAISERDHRWVTRRNEEYEGGFYIYSFENCCEELGFDPQATRKALLQWFEIGKPQKVTINKDTALNKPGVEYSHKYGACGQAAKCEECKSRYRYSYNILVKRPQYGTNPLERALRVRHNHNGQMKIGGVQH